jgi:hypothetical protein
MSKARNPFTDHPHAVGESYFGHLRAASGYSLRLFAAGAAALVHALLPFLFERTASTLIRQMHADMTRRAGGVTTGARAQERSFWPSRS